MTQTLQRTLPQDINAEAAVLSAMMIDTYTVSKAIESLEEVHFYKTAHRLIYRAISALYEDGIEIDIITLIDRLKMQGNLEKVGGAIYINELSDVVLSGANLSYHLEIMLSKAHLRQLIETSNQIIESAYNAEKDVDEIVDEAEQAIFKIAEHSNMKSFVKVADIIPETLHMIEEVATLKKSVVGIPTGFADLDRRLGGFRPGQLVVLAARPAMGKTSFALNIGFYAAMYHNMNVAFFTLEMTADELLMRIFSSAAEVSMDNMLKGYGMNSEKINRIIGVGEALNEKNIYIDDSGSNSALDIRAKSRRLKAELKGLDLIIIDYLQLMSGAKKTDSRQQEISEISRALKVLAKELELPVIALSQLNRGLESRPDKRPILSDLRESGAIEQDADIVMFIYRDEYYNADSDKPGVAEIIVSKNRHGPTGSNDLRFIGEYTSFRNLEEY